MTTTVDPPLVAPESAPSYKSVVAGRVCLALADRAPLTVDELAAIAAVIGCAASDLLPDSGGDDANRPECAPWCLGPGWPGLGCDGTLCVCDFDEHTVRAVEQKHVVSDDEGVECVVEVAMHPTREGSRNGVHLGVGYSTRDREFYANLSRDEARRVIAGLTECLRLAETDERERGAR